MKDKYYAILMMLIIVTIFVLTCWIQNARGYHLQWSQVNLKFIWVNEEGKP